MKKGPRQYGILVEDMSDIISILKGNPKTSKIALFGSRAKGKFEPGSDIDLAWFGEELDLDDIRNAGLAYDKLFLPYKLDLVVYDQIEEPALREHIDRIGIILFEGKNN